MAIRKRLYQEAVLKKNIAIININIEDLKSIANNDYTFPQIIQNQFDSLKYHNDIEKDISKHPTMN